MSEGRALTIAAAIVLLMAGAGAVLLGSDAPADASTLSRGPSGWLAARRYLEEMGTRVALVDHDLEEPVGSGVLVLAFPWQRAAFDDVAGAVHRHLQTGGTVVLGYAGRDDVAEWELVDSMGLTWARLRPRPPLSPRRWHAYAAEEWDLSGDPAQPPRPPRIAALQRAPLPPAGASVLLRDPQRRPVAFAFSRGRGRVVVLPADLLANARVARPGNADFLETLRQDLSGPWLFDEFHHGLRAAPGPQETGPQRVFLLYVLQMAFVYALCALALARRFGPAWLDPPTPGGSAATFLVGLGALHDRLGHHRDAARLLVARARELDPRLAVTETPAEDDKDLLALARRIGASQSARGRSE